MNINSTPPVGTFVRVTNMGPSEHIGSHGTVVGMYEPGTPLVVFEKGQRYTGRPDGSWAVYECVPAPKENSRVRVVNFSDGVNGTLGTVTSWDDSELPYFVRLDSGAGSVWLRPDQIQLIVDEDGSPAAPEVRPSEETGIITDLQAQVERLQATVNSLQRDVFNGRRTVEIIAERAHREANERDYCTEYDDIISEINAEVPAGWELPPRRKFEERRFRIEGTTYRDVTVLVDVTAGNDSDPDNWYSTDDTDEALGEDWVSEQLNEENCENGWDDIEKRPL